MGDINISIGGDQSGQIGAGENVNQVQAPVQAAPDAPDDAGDEEEPSGKGVFISHSHDDADLADGLVELLISGADVPRSSIYCSSVGGTRSDPGGSYADDIRNAIRNAALNIIVVSEAFQASPYCQAELGAIWAREDANPFPLLVPPIGYAQLGGVLSGSQAETLSDPASLDRLYDRVTSALDIRADTGRWSARAQAFLATLDL